MTLKVNKKLIDEKNRVKFSYSIFFQTADKVLVVFNFIQICNIIKNILIYYIEVL